jgi:hypothetical protein
MNFEDEIDSFFEGLIIENPDQEERLKEVQYKWRSTYLLQRASMNFLESVNTLKIPLEEKRKYKCKSCKEWKEQKNDIGLCTYINKSKYIKSESPVYTWSEFGCSNFTKDMYRNNGDLVPDDPMIS